MKSRMEQRKKTRLRQIKKETPLLLLLLIKAENGQQWGNTTKKMDEYKRRVQKGRLCLR